MKVILKDAETGIVAEFEATALELLGKMVVPPETPPVTEEPQDPDQDPDETPVDTPPGPHGGGGTPDVPVVPPTEWAWTPTEYDMSDKPEDVEVIINSAEVINVRKYFNGSNRYQRWQDLLVVKDDVVPLTFQKQNLDTGGGATVKFTGVSYDVLCDGQVVGTFNGEGITRSLCNVDFTNVKDGWHILSTTVHGNESSAPIPIYVFRGDKLPEQKWMPSASTSKDVNRKTNAPFFIKWVPARYDNATAARHQPRKVEYFDNVVAGNHMWVEQIIPVRVDYVRRPNVTEGGILNTANRQWYTWDDFVSKLPRLPLLDGKRGVGNAGYVSHIEVAKATYDPAEVDPNSPLVGNLYFTDPWRFCRVDKYGKVTTLAGYRHPGIMAFWDDPSNVELVGDWSAVPEERRGFRELWGMCWMTKSLESDLNASRIPAEDNRIPHKTGPVAFLSDTQNNRIIRVEFSPTAHDNPPAKITEFLTGLNDAWDVVTYKDTIIVSERKKHRINQYDATTGDLLRTIVSGKIDGASVDWMRFVKRNFPLDVIRQEEVIAPEGLYVMDDWLYYASMAMRQIKRVNLVTGAIELVVNDACANHAMLRYIKIAVSDGTFGPKGTVFATDWSVVRFGGPFIYLPDGTEWKTLGSFGRNLPRGAGKDIASTSYSAGIGVGHGRLVYGFACEGILEVTKKTADDPEIDYPTFYRGRKKWGDAGWDYTHGPNGYGYYGLPLPWGQDPDIDYFLEWNLHANPAKNTETIAGGLTKILFV